MGSAIIARHDKICVASISLEGDVGVRAAPCSPSNASQGEWG